MRCFSRWGKDNATGYLYRDQTILQFGNKWDLRANLILLNPGSALPKNDDDQTMFLRTKNLPFFVEPEDNEKYVDTSIDRLMLNILKLFTSHFDGGTIRIYNLFNLKNQKSVDAVKQFEENKLHPKMFSKTSEIKFCDAPVIIASGGNAQKGTLKDELIKYIGLSDYCNLYKLDKTGDYKYAFLKTIPDETGFIDSYHPSYTFAYGNMTEIGEIKA